MPGGGPGADEKKGVDTEMWGWACEGKGGRAGLAKRGPGPGPVHRPGCDNSSLLAGPAIL